MFSIKLLCKLQSPLFIFFADTFIQSEIRPRKQDQTVPDAIGAKGLAQALIGESSLPTKGPSVHKQRANHASPLALADHSSNVNILYACSLPNCQTATLPPPIHPGTLNLHLWITSKYDSSSALPTHRNYKMSLHMCWTVRQNLVEAGINPEFQSLLTTRHCQPQTFSTRGPLFLKRFII